MREKLLFLFVLFSLVGFLEPLYGQQKLQFNYDLAGNRIERILPIATQSLMAGELPKEIITEEFEKIEVKIYSALAGQITVELSTLKGMDRGTIAVYAFPNGALVTSRQITNLREDIDLSTKPSGIYVLLVTIDGEKTSYKFMKN